VSFAGLVRPRANQTDPKSLKSLMSNDSQQIVSKAWNFAHVLRDDSLSYMAYTEHLAFLLLLKMADKMTPVQA